MISGKKKLKIIYYRDFWKFSNNDFTTQILRDFSTLLLSSDSPSLDLYIDICISKKKHLRANNSPFMNKSLKQ